MRLVMLVVVGMLMTVAAAAKESANLSRPYELKVAIAILEVQGGTGVAKNDLPGIYQKVFTDKGYEVTMGEKVDAAAKKLGIDLSAKEILKEDLWRLGRELGVSHIIPVRVKTTTRYVFVNLMPKAKSTVEIKSVVIGTADIDRILTLPTIGEFSSCQAGSSWQEVLAVSPKLTSVPMSLACPAAVLLGGKLSNVERNAATEVVEKAYQKFFQIQSDLARMFGPPEQAKF